MTAQARRRRLQPAGRVGGGLRRQQLPSTMAPMKRRMTSPPRPRRVETVRNRPSQARTPSTRRPRTAWGRSGGGGGGGRGKASSPWRRRRRMVIDGLPAEFVLGRHGKPPSEEMIESIPKLKKQHWVIECDPLVHEGFESTARHVDIPYLPMLVPPQKWKGYDKGGHRVFQENNCGKYLSWKTSRNVFLRNLVKSKWSNGVFRVILVPQFASIVLHTGVFFCSSAFQGLVQESVCVMFW